MRFLFIIACFFTLFSCTQSLKHNAFERPEKLIPETEMVNLMAEVMVLEAHIQRKYETLNRHYLVMDASVTALIKEKGFSVKDYENSYRYYYQNREVFLSMLDQVEEKLMKESFENQKNN